MKKLLLLLLLSLSFNSYGEWVGFTIDTNENIHYVDFEDMKKTDGYIYYWEMTNYANPTDRFLSIATYREADCDLHRFKDLTFNGYTQEMAEGEPETIDLTKLEEDWDYPVANTFGDISLSLVCQGDTSIEDSYGDWYEVSTHVDGSSSFYMDPDSVKERNGYISFWTLIDYLDDSSENILSQISRRHVNCEEGKLRNESVYSYDDNMGEGEVTIPDEVTISEWMTPPPGSNYDGYIQFGCGINKLSDEELEEIKIEWRAEMEETP